MNNLSSLQRLPGTTISSPSSDTALGVWTIPLEQLAGAGLYLPPPLPPDTDEQSHPELRRFGILREMSSAYLSSLAARSMPIDFAQGHEIKVPKEHILLITQGDVEVFVQDAGENSLPLAVERPGDILGELSAFMPKTHDDKVRLVARSVVKALAFPKDLFVKAVTHCPASAHFAWALSNRRLNSMDLLTQDLVSIRSDPDKLPGRTFGERIADRMTAALGTWTCISGLTIAMATYMTLSHFTKFETWPWLGLNFAVSTLSFFTAPVIAMSQNRLARIFNALMQATKVQIFEVRRRSDQLIELSSELRAGQKALGERMKALEQRLPPLPGNGSSESNEG